MKLATSVAIIGIVIWGAARTVEGRSPGAEEILAAMEAARASVDTFQCTFSTMLQMHGKTVETQEGPTFVFLEDSDWPAPDKARTVDMLVSGERFLVRTPAGVQNSWDGHRGIYYEPGTGRASIGAPPRYFRGSIYDPRAFIYNAIPTESRIDTLRRLLAQGRLRVRGTTFGGNSVLLVEGFDEQGVGCRIWADPSRNFLPVQIEEYSAPGLVYRYTGIEHRQVQPGLWFPVSGTLEHIEYRDANQRGRVRSTVRMEVQPNTINMQPVIGPATFTLELPAGTEVHDTIAGKHYVVAAARDAGEAARLAADEARAILAARPGAIAKHSETGVRRLFGDRTARPNLTSLMPYILWCSAGLASGFGAGGQRHDADAVKLMPLAVGTHLTLGIGLLVAAVGPRGGMGASSGTPDPLPTWIPATEFRRCGPLSLLVLAELSGRHWRLAEVDKHCPADPEGGSSIRDLCSAAAQLGLSVQALRCNAEELEALVPAILYWPPTEGRRGHYCVAAGVNGGQVLIVDPPKGPRWIASETLGKLWDGVVIVPCPEAHTSTGGAGSRLLLGMSSALSVLLGAGLHRLLRRLRRAQR